MLRISDSCERDSEGDRKGERRDNHTQRKAIQWERLRNVPLISIATQSIPQRNWKGGNAEMRIVRHHCIYGKIQSRGYRDGIKRKETR